MYFCATLERWQSGLPKEFLRKNTAVLKTVAIPKGELAEWSNAAVLKTVDLHGSGGSNPSLSAKQNPGRQVGISVFQARQALAFVSN